MRRLPSGICDVVLALLLGYDNPAKVFKHCATRLKRKAIFWRDLNNHVGGHAKCYFASPEIPVFQFSFPFHLALTQPD